MKTVIVKTHDTTKTVNEVKIVTNDGQPNVIKAAKHVNYEFFDESIGRAPNHIITKRVGKDLHVSFEREGKDTDLIIEGFYDNEDQALIGIAEDGSYYHYIPDTGEVYDYVTQLEVGDVEGQALGGEEMLAPWWVMVPAGFPWWIGLGLIPLVIGRDDEDDTPTVVKPDAPTVVITEDKNNDGVISADELDGPVDVTYTVPKDAVIGDTLVITKPDGSTEEVEITQDVIDNGVVREYPAPAEGGKIETSAVIKDPAGNTSAPGKDSAVIGKTSTISVSDSAPVTEADDVYLEYNVKVDSAVGSNVTATISIDPSSTATAGADFAEQLEFFNPTTSAWENIPADGNITLPADTTAVKVRVKVLDDAITENDETVVIKATTTDAQISNGSDTGSGTITDNDKVAIESAAVTLSEEGLAGGIKDGVEAGKTDAELVQQSGKMSVTDGVSIVFDKVQPGTIGGTAVKWEGVGTKSLTAYEDLNGNGIKDSGEEVLTATIDDSGNYTVKLVDTVAHPSQGEDSTAVKLRVKASKGSISADANLTVNILDDSPNPYSGDEIVEVPVQQTNLMFILDLSDSMNIHEVNYSVNGKLKKATRMEVLKDAVQKAITDYDQIGDVRVKIVVFGDDAKEAVIWGTPAQALAYIDSIPEKKGNNTLMGVTNYGAALELAINTYDKPGKFAPSATTKDVSYFITDGNPSYRPDQSPRENIYNNWKKLVTDKDIDSYAYRVFEPNTPPSTIDGVKVDAVEILNKLAFNGLMDQERDSKTIIGANDVSKEISSTINVPLFESNIVRGSGTVNDDFGFGADGGYISSFKIDGDTYTFNKNSNNVIQNPDAIAGVYSYDADNQIVTVKTDKGGMIKLHMLSGNYEYKLNAVGSAYDEIITYSVVDGDGDKTINSVVTLKIAPKTSSFNSDFISLNDSLETTGIIDDNVETGVTTFNTHNTTDSNGSSINSLGALVQVQDSNDSIVVDDISLDKISIPSVTSGDSDMKFWIEGEDTLVINVGDFDLKGTTAIKNIEIINMTDGKTEIVTLSVSDVVNITDSRNTLFINGDAASETATGIADKVNVSGFTKAATSDETGYDLYQDSTGTKLYIDNDIITNII